MLARLQVEHDHILKTLNLLEMQFLDLCRGGTPDFSLMWSILEYIQEYPEQIHHPLEDRIYEELIERADDAEFLQDLIAEHVELENETRKIRETLKLLESGVVSKEEIKKLLSSFLTRQRQHMYVEEEKVHPLIESVLTEKDLERIQTTLPLYKS